MVNQPADPQTTNPNSAQYDPNAPVQVPEGDDLDKMQHSKRDIDLLFRLYLAKRLQSQIGFYQSRIQENEQNSDFTFAAGTLLMTFSSLAATVGASDVNLAWLSLAAAIFSALAAMMASFRQLYAWEKQATIYRDSLLSLERVSLLAPDNDRWQKTDLTTVFPQIIERSEEIFSSEVNQWGQFILSKEKPGTEEAQQEDDLTRAMSGFNLSEDQMNVIRALFASAAGGRQDVTVSANTVKTTDVKVETQETAADASSGDNQGEGSFTITTTTTSQMNLTSENPAVVGTSMTIDGAVTPVNDSEPPGVPVPSAPVPADVLIPGAPGENTDNAPAADAAPTPAGVQDAAQALDAAAPPPAPVPAANGQVAAPEEEDDGAVG
jgi:hypothetical protein